MAYNFGTPARLERQIAQDLMDDQSAFDLSIPGNNPRDISASVTRTPLGISSRHNASFSRASDASDLSLSNAKPAPPHPSPTPRARPVSLAAAVQQSQQKLSLKRDADVLANWRSRRHEQAFHNDPDESTVYQDEIGIYTDLAEPATSSLYRVEIATTPSTVKAAAPESTVHSYPISQNEDTATAYSSPAAARLLRQDGLTGRPLPDTPKPRPGPDRMKQYLLNSVRATDKARPTGKGRSSDAHIDAIHRLKAQAGLNCTPSSRSEGDEVEPFKDSSLPTPRRRMDRVGKVNTIAAGRTPLPKAGVAEMLRRGALLGMNESSVMSNSGTQAPASATGPEQPASIDEPLDEDQDSVTESSAGLSEASSNNLTAGPNASRHGALALRANTSFPGLGAAEAGTEANSFARPRVDPAKLALYQSKLNARLDSENAELKRERDGLLARVEALVAKAANTRIQDATQSHNSTGTVLRSERERASDLDKEAQDLADLLREKEQEIHALQQELRSKVADKDDTSSTDGTVARLRFQVQELQNLVREKDEDLEELEAQLEEERRHMEEQVQQAKAFSLEALDKIEAARDNALAQVESLQNELTASREECEQLRSIAAASDEQNISDASPPGLVGSSPSNTSERQNRESSSSRLTQKVELEQRVKQYRKRWQVSRWIHSMDSQSKDGPAAAGLATPGPALTGSSLPLPKSVMSLRNASAVNTPRSPGPLSEASWLYNESSLGAAGVVEKIVYLESALDQANASIDAKLQQLDEAGVAHLTLAERLENAHLRIAELEAELERLRMLGGASTMAASSSPTKSVSQRQQVFADQRELGVERRERELEDRSVERRQNQDVLLELERFKEAASSLQQDLQSERAKQREMLAQTRSVSHQKSAIEGSLARTQAELEAVKKKLDAKMGGLEELGREYLERSVQPSSTLGSSHRPIMESRLDELAVQFQQAQTEVEALRNEKLDLLSQRADLHRRFASENEKSEKMRKDLAASREALAMHQAQLDEQIEQLEAVHAALRSKKAAFEQVTGDRDRLRAERDEIVRDVGMFEQELRRLRREADRQGQDLETLRAERHEAQRQQADKQQKRSQHESMLLEQIQVLLESKTTEIEHIKHKLHELERTRALSAPPLYAETQSLSHLKDLHEQECKGLLRYFKEQLRREIDLRKDLAHQKHYISLLLKGLTQADHEIILDLRIESGRREFDRFKAQQTTSGQRWRKAITAARSIFRMQSLANKARRNAELKASLQKAHREMQMTDKHTSEKAGSPMAKSS
ncbi:LOW QUALITY PROTEIN: hypothetical protein BCV70DRAFT_199055 [Testicularia cyperi]|uniref:Pericentrin/AKAP-450 centrosomal targeting domain-containing protein n=1 Tax=Testicularia cyperi TaxID=1882483 RepID=A0A317XTG2_9BASI|nr:LOW QUALITY PROTEIN: hypothetical protein BCV70DRAFT_199055 [Testicularia cyperi]